MLSFGVLCLQLCHGCSVTEAVVTKHGDDGNSQLDQVTLALLGQMYHGTSTDVATTTLSSYSQTVRINTKVNSMKGDILDYFIEIQDIVRTPVTKGKLLPKEICLVLLLTLSLVQVYSQH